MIEDITRQPQAGKIGGVPDLMVAITSVERNFSDAFRGLMNGETSPEQGRDHDQVLVSHSETLTPDRLGANFSKVVPWLAMGIFVVAMYALAGKK